MAVSAKAFNKFLTSLLNKEVNWASDTIKVMLCTSTFSPAQATMQYKSSVTNEVVGTGYTAGGATLATKTQAITGQVLALDAADVSWTGATITARYAVVYDDSPATDATKPLIGYVDFGADVSVTSGTLSVAWDAAGICTFTVS